MSCKAGVRCESYKPEIRKINLVEKTGPRFLKEGIFYPECSLLMLEKGSTIFEPWDGVDPCAIRAMVKCDIDGTQWTAPCSAGVLLKGCVNAPAVCWPEAATPEQIMAAIAINTCCIIFEYDYNGCNDIPKELPFKKAIDKIEESKATGGDSEVEGVVNQ